MVEDLEKPNIYYNSAFCLWNALRKMTECGISSVLAHCVLAHLIEKTQEKALSNLI